MKRQVVVLLGVGNRQQTKLFYFVIVRVMRKIGAKWKIEMDSKKMGWQLSFHVHLRKLLNYFDYKLRLEVELFANLRAIHKMRYV